ncbi:NRDE family protein [Oxalobacteraceae bacterium R-40]|uniref:NRDE family protein n=1 Tax=Keguizhuia sedimenti TaxID=3064264 RepID=A0ABU1BRB5_9BURK|nr:NRDE family protein [Oxalobacteraceae bacterium R-40]
MCLIVFAWQLVRGTPLVAVGNRDEFYDRPAEPAGWWKESPDILAGRDLRSGGTWLGVTRAGRFAAVTNVRNPALLKPGGPTRGALVSEFLAGTTAARTYIEQLRETAQEFSGFNLLVCDGDELIWYSNAAADDPRNGQPLAPGFYGLSNAFLDTPWPKVVRTKAQFASLLCQDAPDEAYFDMLSDTMRASDCRLPKTGVSIEMERMLSAVCIESPDYGTRVSTVVRMQTGAAPVLHEVLVR